MNPTAGDIEDLSDMGRDDFAKHGSATDSERMLLAKAYDYCERTAEEFRRAGIPLGRQLEAAYRTGWKRAHRYAQEHRHG